MSRARKSDADAKQNKTPTNRRREGDRLCRALQGRKRALILGQMRGF